MFIFATFIGIYAYIIFALGILGLIYKPLIISLTVIFWGSFLLWKRQELWQGIKKIKLGIIGLLIVLQALINLIGVFGPERGFDALWYHLTLPKLYLLSHSIFFIPGGLLYYSAMPKLAEMLYVAGLSFGTEQFPKLIHYTFGLLSCLALYKLQRKFFRPLIATLGVIIFYSNLVVGWESSSAYIDLIRTFFEVMALWGFVNWWEKQRRIWFIASAIMVGLAITTKLLAVASLVIFSCILLYYFLDSHLRGNDKFTFKKLSVGLLIYWITAFVLPMPWFIFAYLHTGNSLYPFFTKLYTIIPEPLNLFNFLKEIWVLFTQAADPLSLFYILLLPLVIWVFPQLKIEIKLIAYYSLLAIIIWYFTPRTGGGRFILPYLPAFSMVVAAGINEIRQNKKYPKYLGRILVGFVIVFALFSITYRFLANYKYVSLLLGKETKAEFMAKNLNFSFGDFYDTDGYFDKKIKATDMVLLYGFHNLYYVNFPFIDTTWVQKGNKFNYIATQKVELPKRFRNWQLIYKNDKTMVKLYAPSGQCELKCIY